MFEERFVLTGERFIELHLGHIGEKSRRIIVDIQDVNDHFDFGLLLIFIRGDDPQWIVSMSFLSIERLMSNSQTQIIAGVLFDLESFAAVAGQLVGDAIGLGQILVVDDGNAITLSMMNVRVLGNTQMDLVQTK